MSVELDIEFPDPTCVVIRHKEARYGPRPFCIPLTSRDREDLDWYLEACGTRPYGPHADQRANEVAARLSNWGDLLFQAVFHEPAARSILRGVQREAGSSFIVTIVARHPSILALPWELLRAPIAGYSLDASKSWHIHVRRRLASVLVSIEDMRAPFDQDGPSPSLRRWRSNVPFRVRPTIRRRSDRLLADLLWLRRRVLARGRRFLTMHRAPRISWLLIQVFFDRPEDIERPGSFTRRIATPLAMPIVAAGLFGIFFALALEQVMRAALGSRPVLADDFIQLLTRLRLIAGYGGMAIAVVAIYLVATLNYVITATVWRLLTIVSSGGRVPAWRWFVSRASSGCAYLSLFVAAIGILAPYLYRGATRPLSLQQIVLVHPILVLTSAILLVLLHQLRTRNIAAVNVDIWGSRWKAVAITIVRLALLFALPWLLAMIIHL